MKTNPIRETVSVFIPSGRRRKKKPKITIEDFFNDLENRGPLHPMSLFETWAFEIREDMQSRGLWTFGDEVQNLNFVVEYISRLQRKFWDSYPENWRNLDLIMEARFGYSPRRGNLQWKALKAIYLKIRIFGLRTKTFGLCAWSRNVPLISFVDKYYERYGKSLYTVWQISVRYRRFVGAKNRPLPINPKGIEIPFRDSFHYR